MHLLIIPSEEYLPKENHLLGIFQRDQAHALVEYGLNVGIIGISLQYSVFMILKAIAFKLKITCKKNSLYNWSVFSLLLLLYKSLVQHVIFKFEFKQGIKVLRATGFYWPYPSERTNLKSWLGTCDKAFAQYLKKYGKPDLVHAHNVLYAGIAAKRISKKYDIPYIITEHSSVHAREVIPEFYISKIKNSYIQSDCLLAVSPKLADLLMVKYGLPKNYINVVPNILDDVFDTLNEEKLNYPFKNFTYLNVASLDINKNQKLLINSFAEVVKQYSNSILKIVGDGPMLEELEKLVHELNLSNNVFFLGRLSREQVLNELLHCSVFVLSSTYETFGVVLIEALACGKPVIATRCGGPESIVKPDNGILVNKESVLELVEAMKFVHDNLNSFNNLKISKDCLNTYGKRAICEMLITQYSKVQK